MKHVKQIDESVMTKDKLKVGPTIEKWMFRICNTQSICSAIWTQTGEAIIENLDYKRRFTVTTYVLECIYQFLCAQPYGNSPTQLKFTASII